MRYPVFIVGMPRSGTSLLSAILNTHSELAVAPETHYFTRCWDGPVKDRDHAHDLLDCLFEQPGVGDMELSAEERASIRSGVDAAETPTHRDILEALLDIYRARENKPCSGEKTPDHWAYVREIQETFPDAVFLSIVRDPRDVSLSLRRVPWNQRQTVIDHARSWRRYARCSADYLADDGIPFQEIRYEDLLTDSEAVIRAVLAFLDASYEPQLAEFYRSDSINVDTAREPWKSKTTRPIDPSNRNNWVQEMPPVEQKIVESICGSDMERKGYVRTNMRWRVSMLPPLARIAALTVTGRLHRLWSTPWYRRPEARSASGR